MFIMVLRSQTNISFSLQQKLIKASFDTSYVEQTQTRKIVAAKSFVTKINPLFYIGGALLFVYQNVFSEQIQAQCAYQVSCSEYTKRSIQKKGLLFGTLSGFNQLSECYPYIQHDHPTLFINYNNQKIINTSD